MRVINGTASLPTTMRTKEQDRQRKKIDRIPDKNCLRCGHEEKKALRVVGKTENRAKVVLCVNCIEELKD